MQHDPVDQTECCSWSSSVLQQFWVWCNYLKDSATFWRALRNFVMCSCICFCHWSCRLHFQRLALQQSLYMSSPKNDPCENFLNCLLKDQRLTKNALFRLQQPPSAQLSWPLTKTCWNVKCRKLLMLVQIVVDTKPQDLTTSGASSWVNIAQVMEGHQSAVLRCLLLSPFHRIPPG